MSLRTTAADRFDSFDFYTTSYKKIGDHKIEVFLLVPKDIKPGKHPVFVKWHGGGLTTGTAEYPDWFSGFWIPFLQRNSAITILPNYRLAPEANGNDILEDISSFWTWFRQDFPAYLSSIQPSISADYDKVLVSGDSAGGWCALQSAMSLPQNSIKASIIQYPLTNAFDMATDFKPFGHPIPPKEVLDEHLKSIPPGTILTSANPSLATERNMFSAMLRAHKRWDEVFGSEPHLMPDTRLQSTRFWVPTWIIHGTDDTVVDIRYSERFVDAVRNKFGDEATIELVTAKGEHGFDIDVYEEDEGAEWLGKCLGEVEKVWLA